MAKKRRPPRRKQQPPEDSEDRGARVLTGEIPWTFEELGEVLKHAATLHNTPHDDWDRREKGITLLKDDGTVSRLVINPDMMENQLISFIIKRLRERGASDEIVMSHGWRFWESMAFLIQNGPRLRQERLVIDDPSDPEATLLSGGLIQILATAQYEGVRLQGDDSDPVRSFHLERVIADAKRLDAEDEREQEG